jgi:hypothetical protein
MQEVGSSNLPSPTILAKTSDGLPRTAIVEGKGPLKAGSKPFTRDFAASVRRSDPAESGSISHLD